MPLKSRDNGTYVANWVPSVCGNYLIQVFIDGKSIGIVLVHYNNLLLIVFVWVCA